MKNHLFIIYVLTLMSISVNAQQVIEFPYSKQINKNDGKWETKWNSEEEIIGTSPMLILKKVKNGTYSVRYISNFPESAVAVFYDVVYDPVKTEQIRKKNSNNNLTAYKYPSTGYYFGKYLWASNITLEDIVNNPSKWASTRNAKIYMWGEESAMLYSNGVSLTSEQIFDGY